MCVKENLVVRGPYKRQFYNGSYLTGSGCMDGDHDLDPKRLVLHVDRVRVELTELGEEEVARKNLQHVLHLSRTNKLC